MLLIIDGMLKEQYVEDGFVRTRPVEVSVETAAEFLNKNFTEEEIERIVNRLVIKM